MNLLNKILRVAPLSVLIALGGCDFKSNDQSDAKAQHQEEIALAQAQSKIGIAHIVNFTEKALANRILEMRDQPNLATYTYLQGMDGRLLCLGRSIGYGLPYSTQTTNPEKIVDNYSDSTTSRYWIGLMPQAEPNGLFMPDEAAGTWVVLVTPDGSAEPQYVEPNVVTLTFQPTDGIVSIPCK
jgi:hypothetical protein